MSAHTLYGSFDNDFGAPQSDSLNNYSSAYEILGEPPTFGTNHVLTPFVSTFIPGVTPDPGNNNTVGAAQIIGTTTYYVEAVCPNFSTAGTKINAPVSATYSNIPGNQPFAGMNTFATWFPTGVLSPPGLASGTNGYDPNHTAFVDNAASDVITNGTGDIYPPALAGCSPAYNATDNLRYTREPRSIVELECVELW